MSDEIQPVENAPAAGQEQTPAEVVPEANAEEIKTDTSILDAIAVVEESDKALAAAETKIVSLKRKLKGTIDSGNSEEANELRTEIDSLKEKITALETAKADDTDKDLSEIQAIRKKNAELIVALRAKSTITSDSGGGSNQDKIKPAEDFSKTLNVDQKALYQRMADDRGLTLNQVLEAKARFGGGLELITQLNKLKK